MRSALDGAGLASRLIGSSSLVSAVRLVEQTESTNADAMAAAAAGVPTGLLVVAEHQVAGRGRFDRAWSSPARSAVLMSLLVRPPVSRAQWGWLPLLTGLALRAAVSSGAPDGFAALKWPNDLQLGTDRRKAAGILVQASGDAAVIGIGLNVDQTAGELPVPTATSLRLELGSPPDRADVLVAIVEELSQRYSAWLAAGGDAGASGLRAEYEQVCETIGRSVRVERADGPVVGRAEAIDPSGSLVVATAAGRQIFSAGDVIHLRPGER